MARWSAVGAALALAACGALPPDGGEAPAPITAPAAGTRAAPGAITLITGDRVTLVKTADRVSPRIQHGPGRERITFSISRHAGEITVVPEDVAALVGDGRLDRALFNVTRLIADGYGDDRRDDLPLLVTGQPDAPALRSRMASAGLTVDRALPALAVVAVRQRKASGGAVLATLAAAAPAARLATAAAAGPRIWLDRRLRIALDHSVPQIGAPAAYARGFTGAGVTVAVLDTGIDTTHPDLAGKVLAAENFVDDGLGTSDVVGHATHVASIIAGTGAASGGQFHGVAPDAMLLSGRVCDQTGCPESAILAGLAWAVVTQHAPIVNLSLGGDDFPGIDPLEDAVNQLSAQYGTLFVIAAGNFGFGPGTVDSPGSADAALTVGAVDRDDHRAEFSGQGPRIGDHAIKPDIMAPGVDITAARAAGTQLGTPVGDFYVKLSGTSMATPHVAGAAAILLQQHPDWTGAQLKSALIGAARPDPTLTVYQQGSGRVDVDRVTRQTVTADAGSLSLGIAAFPHDDDPPIVRSVRYRNAGTEPVVLALAATLTSQHGLAAPPGMVAVAPSTLTVPAGGTADATVTVDTRVAAPDDIYGGTLTATGDAVRILTPLGVEREVESHDLTVTALGRDGQPGAAEISIFGVGAPGDPVRDVNVFFTPIAGQATFRLPRGTYTVESFSGPSGDEALLYAPRVAVTGDTGVTMDGRVARPIDVTLPQSDLVLDLALYDYEDIDHDIASAIGGPALLLTGEIGPAAPPGEVHSEIHLDLAPDGEHPALAYHLVHSVPDHFATGWTQTLRRADFATVRASHAAADGQTLFKTTAGIPNAGGFINGSGFFYPGPFERTDFYYGPDATWDVELSVAGVFEIEDAINTYPAGKTFVESWNQAPFGPAFSGPTLFSLLRDRTGAPARKADVVALSPSMFSDQSTPGRAALVQLTQSRLTLFLDGQAIAQNADPVLPFAELVVPPERRQYRLEEDVSRSATGFELSTHVTAAWTFASQHVDGDTQHLPLPTLRFTPRLDEHNRSAAPVLVLPVAIERPVGAATPRIASAHVEASFDDGATWHPVPLVRFDDRALGVIVHPRDASHVSLRGGAADVDGNTVEQTIIRAYGLAQR